MFRQVQFTAVWMTTAMLFVQSVCSGVAFGCSCQQSFASLCLAEQESCRCSVEMGNSLTGTCPHCNPLSEPDESEDGFRQDSYCDCGDFVPTEQAPKNVPDSTSTWEHLLDVIVCTNHGVTAPLVEAPVPAPPSVPSSEERTHNYQQVVLCVWLT